MKKEVKVVMITSEKASMGQIYLKPKMNVYNEIAVENHNNGIYDTKPQNLHFLSDEEIKEGDWRIMLDSFGNVFSTPQQYLGEREQHYLNKGHRKIIASTDQSLGLPIPSNESLKKYCDNNGVGRVEVEYEGIEWLDRPLEYFVKVNTDDTINASFVDDRLYTKSDGSN